MSYSGDPQMYARSFILRNVSISSFDENVGLVSANFSSAFKQKKYILLPLGFHIYISHVS